MQQHATGWVNGRSMLHSTVLGVVGQQCCVPSHGASGVTLNPFFDFFLHRVAFYLFRVRPHRFNKSVSFPSVGHDRWMILSRKTSVTLQLVNERLPCFGSQRSSWETISFLPLQQWPLNCIPTLEVFWNWRQVPIELLVRLWSSQLTFTCSFK